MDKYIVSKTTRFSKRFNKIAYLMLYHITSRNPLGPHFIDTLNSMSSFKIKYYKSKDVLSTILFELYVHSHILDIKS